MNNGTSGQLKSGVTSIVGLLLVVAWLWGVASYAQKNNWAGAAGAFVIPPIGVLHAVGAF
jgi:hypothetical protein